MTTMPTPDTSTPDIIERLLSAPAVHAVRPGATEDDVARMMWSSIIEPGDRVAGALIDVYGAMDALTRASAAREPDLAPVIDTLVDCGHRIERDDLAEGMSRWTARRAASNIVAQVEAAARVEAQVVFPGDAAWPAGLSGLGSHAPCALWLRGNLATLEGADRSIAMVGARASTGYGEHVTMQLVSGLVNRQYLIVSGAAYGIDGMAHRAALADEGETVAVLAGGIDRLYPSGHDALLQRIISTGAVVTEMPPGFSPTKWRFLQRNRLIAAMTQATVVVEAGWRSGSLNTAHHALDLNRPVGVVPGPVTSAASAGCHRLLRETPAVCVTDANDILGLLGDGV